MPWLTIFITLLTFFAAGGSNKEKRGKAAALALGAGAATYGVTHYTDWGKETLGAIDGVEMGVSTSGKTTIVDRTGSTEPSTKNEDGSKGSVSTAGNSGFWNAISGALSSPLGSMAVGGAAGAIIGSTVPNWVVLAAIGLGAYLILKD